MKKIISLILLSILNANYVFADTPSSPIIKSMKKGNVAPYDGILYNYEANSILQTELEYSEQTCTTKNAYNIKLANENCITQKKQIIIQQNTDKQISKTEIDACFKQVKTLEDTVSKPATPIVLENKNEKIWWMFMGVGAGATIAGVTTYLIMKFKQ